MIMNPKPTMEKVYWADVREQVDAVNPILAKNIDQLSPGKRFPLWRAKYPFGAKILHNGRPCVPDNKGGIISIDDPAVERAVYNDLTYAPNMPMGVVLKNTIDLHCCSGNLPISQRFMMPGRVFALWALLQEPGTSSHIGSMWNITSGCRLLMLLSKISNTAKFGNLKKEFGLKSNRPNGLVDQFPLLCELANHPAVGSNWYSEVLCFSKAWFEKLRDPGWLNLYNCLIKMVQEETSFLRDDIVFNYAISSGLLEKNLKPNPYLIDTVKHIFTIARDTFPGFKMADDELTAPIAQLEHIFTSVYGLKFIPTFVHHGFLTKNQPVYYSLEIPTQLSFLPRSSKALNKLNDLREIKHIQSNLIAFLLEDSLDLAGTPIFSVAKSIDYRYYHSDFDKYKEIALTNTLLEGNKTLIEQAKKYPSLPFCSSSPFLTGCVQIRHKA